MEILKENQEAVAYVFLPHWENCALDFQLSKSLSPDNFKFYIM